MKNRTELAKYFAGLGFKTGAEIGVCKGRYSKVLCENIPGLKLVAVDSWGNTSGSRREYHHRKSARKQTSINLAPFDGVTILHKTSMEAVRDIPDESLDFVFIDADHSYQAVKEDVGEWTKKVKLGGIVSGHDYLIHPGVGVIEAVDEYVNKHGYELKLTDWDNENPEKDHRQPCWYFFKGHAG